MTEEIFTQITFKINSQTSEIASPYIVGINGYDASGKTKFTKNYHQWLEDKGYTSTIIHIDDFHNNLAKRRDGETEIQAYIDNAFNLDLVSDLLQRIAVEKKLSIDLQLLDLDTDAYTLERRYEITPDMIVLVEGVLLYRPPLNQYFDYRIYLDVDVEICIERNVARSDKDPDKVRKRYLNKYLKIQNWYYEKYRPAELVDIVINNNDYNNPEILKS